MAALARLAYIVLPHMEAFNLRSEATIGVVPGPEVLLATGAYGLLYAFSVILVASAVFSLKEFR